MPFWTRAALVTALATQAVAGCSLLGGAMATHNGPHGGGRACVSEPTFAVVDFVLAAAATGAVVGSEAVDDTVAWMIIPGVFVASGVIGSLSAHFCQQRLAEGSVATPAPAGPFDQPPVIPPAIVPPPETTGITPIEPIAPAPIDPARPRVELRLDPDSALGAGEIAPANDKIPCGVNPPVECPARHSCLIEDNNQGYCVPDRQH